MYGVYVLEYANPEAHVGRYYVGQTGNVFRRVVDHVKGRGAIRTYLHGVKQIVCVLSCVDRQAAITTEHDVQELADRGLVFPEPPCSFISPRGLLMVEQYLEPERATAKDRRVAAWQKLMGI